MRILDFGGNFGSRDKGVGNLIENFNIKPDLYTCVDIDKKAMDKGRAQYPRSKWVHYDRYNPMYNSGGQKDILPRLTELYDVIFSYSVFSHTSYEELTHLIKFLRAQLKLNGRIFCSVPCSGDRIIKWIYDKRVRDYGSCDDIFHTPDSYFYLVNNKITDVIPQKCRHLFTVYNSKFIRSIGEVISTSSPQTFIQVVRNA